MAQALPAAEGHVCLLSLKSNSRSHYFHLQAKSMLKEDLDISAKHTSLQRAGLARCGVQPAERSKEVRLLLTSPMLGFAVVRMPSFDSPLSEYCTSTSIPCAAVLLNPSAQVTQAGRLGARLC